MKSKDRSIHTTYERPRRFVPHSRAILDLLRYVIAHDQYLDKSKMLVLDVGCGTGRLTEALAKEGIRAIGLDFDPTCVSISSQYGECILADVENIDTIFRENAFDILIASHSLEHFPTPVEMVEKMKRVTRKWLIFAVPNPTRPYVLKSNIFKKDYSNLGHVCCWDRSHFKVFLERRCNLKIEKWAVDEVNILEGVYFSLPTRLIGRSWFEQRLLPRIFPYFSSSVIALARKEA